MSLFAITLDEATPRLRILAGYFAGSGQGAKFCMRWGARVRKTAILNALGKGGRRFWKDIARSINLVQDGQGVQVQAKHVAAAQKQFGGVIHAKGKAAGGADALTIPIAPESEGQSAAKFALSGLDLYTRGNVLGYNQEGGDFHPLFALVKATKFIPADPFMPENSEVLDMGLEEANMMINA